MRPTDYPTEELEVTIEEINNRANGVAVYRHEPFENTNGKHLKLFIPKTIPGDVVKVTVENAKGRRQATVNYDKLVKPSPDRDLSITANDALIGGTPLIYMNYEAQLKLKESLVKSYLSEKDFDTSVVRPIIGMKDPNRYRNKMELTFGKNGELGMHEQGNYKNIIDMEDSILAPEIMVKMKKIISQWQKNFKIPGFDKDTQSGVLRKLIMRYSFKTNELMAVIYAMKAPSEMNGAAEELTDRLIKEFTELKSLQWGENTDRSEQIIVDEMHVLAGRKFIYDELNGYRYKIYPNTFFQVNPTQASLMVREALKLAQVDKTTRMVDLFCGMGTFSLPFAARARELVGIELVEESIISARQNAKEAGLTNTYFFADDARAGLQKLKEEWDSSDLLILNPPRSGAGGKMMRSVGRYGSDQVLYISCNPKTLALDLIWLRDYGYELKAVQPIDQFPHTMHVEALVLIEKIKY